MFRIFRKIRLDQVKGQRFIRYLLYAFGEIVLVVLGILIALYLNEQKEFREDRAKELTYLQSFQQDLERNLTELDRVLEKSNNIIQSSDSLMALGSQGLSDLPPGSLNSLMDGLLGYTKHMTRQGTIEDLLGSGDLEVIRNDTIRRAMATWDADLKLVREVEVDVKASFTKTIDYLNQHILMFDDPRTAFEKEQLLSKKVFLNHLFDRAITADLLNESYAQLKPVWTSLHSQVMLEIQNLEKETD